MHKACVYLSHYGAVTFFLQMERVRQEDCTHLKQTTHAMQREKQQTKQLKRNAMQCNAMQPRLRQEAILKEKFTFQFYKILAVGISFVSTFKIEFAQNTDI